MKVYLDDLRDTPVGWTRTYTVEETISLLKTKQVEQLSLDNDLGEGETEGHKTLDWLCDIIYHDKTFPIPVISIHSSNPVRVKYMQVSIEFIERLRQKRNEEQNEFQT